MSKITVTGFALLLLLFLGNSSGNYAAQLKQNHSDTPTGTFQKMIVENGLTDAAAIASSVAADIYGAHILKRSIESDRQNFTRFFLLPLVYLGRIQLFRREYKCALLICGKFYSERTFNTHNHKEKW